VKIERIMQINNNQFSKREKDIIRLLLQGKGNKQIALKLERSNRTVEFHLSNIYGKLGVHTRAEALLKLAESHLRDSTGSVPVNTTVAFTGDSTENRFKSILRRIPVKKMYFLIGGLLAIILVATIIVFNPLAQNSAIPAEQMTATSVIATLPPVTPIAIETPLPIIQPTSIVISPHTVNGYTAAIESAYADMSHIIFQVRITGGKITFGDEHYYDRIGSYDLYDEYGNIINASGGRGPAVDPTLFQFEFVPVTLLKGDHAKGQFVFDLNDPSDYNQTLARFSFDFELPIYPETRFYPKQVTTTNELEMLLDSVTVTPTFTQVYLCFQHPSFAPWDIGSQTTLQIGSQETSLYNSRLLFGSDMGGDRRAGSEPYWAPPIKNGHCHKIGFPIGSSNPTSLKLTIPKLEKLAPDILLTKQLAINYPGLGAREAYYKYLEEQGNVYAGPWTFTVEPTP
jgi:DNA-binding CsgD family transcriptional regulator